MLGFRLVPGKLWEVGGRGLDDPCTGPTLPPWPPREQGVCVCHGHFNGLRLLVLSQSMRKAACTKTGCPDQEQCKDL